jgi:putative ABC transport system substrate-binding protein
MRRRKFLKLFGGATVASWPCLGEAQQVGKTPRIGMLWHAANAEEEKFPLGQFRQGLKDLGYVDGQNIMLELRFPAEVPDRFHSMAAELARMNVDILFAVTRPAALAAQRATKTIPIVFMAVPDPVGSKLVDTLSRPGGNITGLSNMALELTPKRVELLMQTAGLTKVALLVNANDSEGARRYVELSQTAVGHLGIHVEPIEVRTPADFENAFAEVRKRGLQGVVVTQDGLLYAEQPQMFRLAFKHKLPLIAYSREMAVNGALMTYGPSNAAMFRRAAVFVDLILKGSKKVGDLPVEQPAKFELVINMKTAATLGIEIPKVIRLVADEVIE